MHQIHQCLLCKMQAIKPVSLLCSHPLCYKCAQNIAIQENTSQIQNKYRIQCPKCRKLTHTYDVNNLLIENNELNLITDSSEMDREILNEVHIRLLKKSQLQSDPQVATRYQPEKTAQQKMSQLLTQTNNKPEKSKQTNVTMGGLHKQSATVSIPMDENRSKVHQPQIFGSQFSSQLQKTLLQFQQQTEQQTQQFTDILKPNNNTPNASPYSTPLASQFHINFTDNKKQNAIPQNDKKYTQEMKENQFQKEFQKEITEPSRHKRSATGVPNQKQQPLINTESVIQQYFSAIQKGLEKLEKDTLLIAKNKNVAPQALYQKMKLLSQTKDPDGELVQSIRMMIKLQAELIGLSTPTCHRKTSSHASNRYSNNTTNTKSDHSSTSILQAEFKNFKKLF